jgi:hypothetical protein
MKHILVLLATVLICGLTQTAPAQTNTTLTSGFLAQTKAAGDSQLVTLASELTGKLQSFSTALGTNAELKARLDGVLKSFTAGKDLTALTNAFNLAAAAKLTPEQVGLAKQVGNLASAYTVQKNFASLDGAQGDVATIVNSLRKGEITKAAPAIQSIAQNAKLTPGQKELVGKLADNYAPGLKKAANAVKSVKLPGF